MIHPQAVVDKSAQIDETAEVGAFAVVGRNTVIGPDTKIFPHSVIECAHIGAGCKIFPGASVGLAPQDLKYRDEDTRVVIGDKTVVRECVTLNRGTSASGSTNIGSGCLFMAYSHVAHDCRIGNEVILANSVAVAGHVEIGDNTVIGGLAGIHQYVRIGRMAMIGAGSMVPLDVPPFTLGSGDRMKLVGLNVLGLKRKRINLEVILAIKKAYRSIFLSKSSIEISIKKAVKNDADNTPEVREFLDFMQR